VEQRLQAHWSPESIAGRLALDYPKPPARRVSHEAIYRWIYREAQAGGQICRRLRWQHQRRRQQRSSWELSAD
jgi:transposase, IS30 family